eukprot:TRINITY_DN61948_c0_g1_i1.p1 TRINITY_DN61948_c0_g1~~TRINITY_DN61948_c0_g1_i1.p1  ORF type:complete len:405 (+),score=44.55 TRINITY_DN61948_c0_g1_i1:164-1378(+)
MFVGGALGEAATPSRSMVAAEVADYSLFVAAEVSDYSLFDYSLCTISYGSAGVVAVSPWLHPFVLKRRLAALSPPSAADVSKALDSLLHRLCQALIDVDEVLPKPVIDAVGLSRPSPPRTSDTRLPFGEDTMVHTFHGNDVLDCKQANAGSLSSSQRIESELTRKEVFKDIARRRLAETVVKRDIIGLSTAIEVASMAILPEEGCVDGYSVLAQVQATNVVAAGSGLVPATLYVGVSAPLPTSKVSVPQTDMLRQRVTSLFVRPVGATALKDGVLDQAGSNAGFHDARKGAAPGFSCFGVVSPAGSLVFCPNPSLSFSPSPSAGAVAHLGCGGPPFRPSLRLYWNRGLFLSPLSLLRHYGSRIERSRWVPSALETVSSQRRRWRPSSRCCHCGSKLCRQLRWRT